MPPHATAKRKSSKRSQSTPGGFARLPNRTGQCNRASEHGDKMTARQARACVASSENDQSALSIVVPVDNEAGNIAPLIEEIVQTLATEPQFEIVYVGP